LIPEWFLLLLKSWLPAGILGRILGCNDFNQRSGTLKFDLFFEIFESKRNPKDPRLADDDKRMIP